MHNNVLILTIAVMLFASGSAQAEIGKVRKVMEGDLIELADGRKIRLIGIDTPDSQATERAKMFAERSGKKLSDILSVGKKSKKFVEGLLSGKAVRLEYDLAPQDGEGNTLAYVYVLACTGKCTVEAVAGQEYAQLDDGLYLFVNATIVKSGYASPLILPPNVKYSALFKGLFLQAKNSKVGLWSSKD